MDSPSNAVLVLGLGRKWYHSLNHGRPKGGISSLRLSLSDVRPHQLGCEANLIKSMGLLLVLAEVRWEPPCVMVRVLGVDDGTEGFHQCVNVRFIESTLLYDLLPFGMLSAACHYKAWNYCEPHRHLTNTKSVVPALEDSTFFSFSYSKVWL